MDITKLKNDLKYRNIFNLYGKNFSKISRHPNLPEDFIRTYLNRLNLKMVSKYSSISKEFFVEYYDVLKSNYCLKILKKYQPELFTDEND